MRFIYLLILLITFSYSNSCIKCHNGIEHIRDPKSKNDAGYFKMWAEEGQGPRGNELVLCVTGGKIPIGGINQETKGPLVGNFFQN